jgi:hypothetical protein
MKRLLIILMLAATSANAQTYQLTGNEGTIRLSGSLDVVPADYRNTARPFEREPAVMTVENKGVFFAGLAANTGGNALAPQTEELKERMMNDKGIMSLISAMQNDPEMQELLGDPAVMNAIQSGDIGALISNPAFLKLLENPRVREIEKRLESGGTK